MAKSCKTPLLRFVEARKEYLDLNVMAGLAEESESFKKLSDDTSSSIQTHIRALAGISPQDAKSGDIQNFGDALVGWPQARHRRSHQ